MYVEGRREGWGPVSCAVRTVFLLSTCASASGLDTPMCCVNCFIHCSFEASGSPSVSGTKSQALEKSGSEYTVFSGEHRLAPQMGQNSAPTAEVGTECRPTRPAVTSSDWRARRGLSGGSGSPGALPRGPQLCYAVTVPCAPASAQSQGSFMLWVNHTEARDL